jgi:hypothetical protein
MVDARRMVRRHYGQDRHPVFRTLARLLTALAWPFAALMHMWQIRRDRGRESVPIKRMPEAFWAAVRHNILPGEYYAYELWHPERRANVDNYLYSNEASRLFKLLNRPGQPDPIGDKLAFHDMCQAQALPTPAILAAFAHTGTLIAFESGRPPECDLFVKPQLGLSGGSAERLRWEGDDFASDRGRSILPGDLEGYLTARARDESQTLIVQPVLFNHPSLGAEVKGGLATARLVTGRSKDGSVIPIFGFIYFPRHGSVTSRHGSVALIDVANGRLMSAPPPDRSGAMHWNHRFDHGSCETVTLPDWEKALRHAQVAHQACASFAFVGWDLAFTDQGPMLLEGNANWSADEIQSLSGTPLGQTEFTDILEDGLNYCERKDSLTDANAP